MSAFDDITNREPDLGCQLSSCECENHGCLVQRDEALLECARWHAEALRLKRETERLRGALEDIVRLWAPPKGAEHAWKRGLAALATTSAPTAAGGKDP